MNGFALHYAQAQAMEGAPMLAAYGQQDHYMDTKGGSGVYMPENGKTGLQVCVLPNGNVNTSLHQAPASQNIMQAEADEHAEGRASVCSLEDIDNCEAWVKSSQPQHLPTRDNCTSPSITQVTMGDQATMGNQLVTEVNHPVTMDNQAETMDNQEVTTGNRLVTTDKEVVTTGNQPVTTGNQEQEEEEDEAANTTAIVRQRNTQSPQSSQPIGQQHQGNMATPATMTAATTTQSGSQAQSISPVHLAASTGSSPTIPSPPDPIRNTTPPVGGTDCHGESLPTKQSSHYTTTQM